MKNEEDEDETSETGRMVRSSHGNSTYFALLSTLVLVVHCHATMLSLRTLLKIALLIAGLMTAAAYLVLLERWIAAWVQDRLGPNRVGIPLTKIRLFGLGQPWPTA